MNTKSLVTYAAVAVGVWFLLRNANALPAGLPEWAYLRGMSPESDQARMLWEQERDFFKRATVSGDRGTPVGWYSDPVMMA